MKCTIPEIFWHNREPVLSVDIQPKPLPNDPNKNIRLASAGSDTHVLIWYVKSHDETTQLELASDLTRHQRAVNVVRWSPCGEFLASGDDESVIFLWKLKNDCEPINILDDVSDKDQETWVIMKTLRGHLEDVYDLAWSMDSSSIISGSVDNTAIVWDVKKGRSQAMLKEHKSFVQGVAWDPRNKYMATLSSDRTFRLYSANTMKVQRRINKSTYPVDESSPYHNKTIRLFHDDTLQTFYRRICFSPDGLLIFTPSGCTDVVASNNSNSEAAAQNADAAKADDEVQAADVAPTVEPTAPKSKSNKLMSTTYIFSRYDPKRPLVVIPSPDHFTIAVRCCPQVFELRPYAEDRPPLIDLPYRIVFAVASKSSIYLYDTQQKIPFGCISNIHYARLTDLTWSSDGLVLLVSSVDGFCTLITFEPDELGVKYTKPIILESENDNKENLQRSNKKRKSTADRVQRSASKSDGAAKAATPATTSTTTSAAATAAVEQKPSEPTQTTADSKPSMAFKGDVIVQIPETIIATAETFESPEYKTKQATPIAIRREPRTNPSTPAASEAKSKPKPIAVRRQPRTILASPRAVDKSAAHQDEAQDAWPIPIDAGPKVQPMDVEEPAAERVRPMDADQTEDIRLVYEGDSELTLLKPASKQPNVDATKPDAGESSGCEAKSSAEATEAAAAADVTATPESKNTKTPRRVQLKTISTPKSRKKLIN